MAGHVANSPGEAFAMLRLYAVHAQWHRALLVMVEEALAEA